MQQFQGLGLNNKKKRYIIFKQFFILMYPFPLSSFFGQPHRLPLLFLIQTRLKGSLKTRFSVFRLPFLWQTKWLAIAATRFELHHRLLRDSHRAS